MSQRCLLVTHGTTQASYRWDGLIAVISNKVGAAHADDDLPVAVDVISQFTAGGVPVLRYALRVVAGAVSREANALLASIGSNQPIRRIAPIQPNAGFVDAVIVRGYIDSHLEVIVHTRVAPGTELAGWNEAGTIEWLFNPPELPGVEFPKFSTDWGKTARNAPCPCGSGNKFKKCCGSTR